MALSTTDKLKYSYFAFIFCIITSSVPQMTVQNLSLLFSLFLIITLYVIRKKWDKESSEHKEMGELIKSYWIWSVLFIVGIMCAGVLVSSFGDMTAINAWTESVVNGAVVDEEEMKRVTAEYMDTNFSLIITSTILSILPAQIYAILRIKSGLSRLKPSAPEVVESTNS